jgi:hypothetical protein
MKVGYARAARLLDEMEEAGIVGPADGAKPREVFTEHMAPEPEEELSPDEVTMDAGGTIFDEGIPAEETTDSIADTEEGTTAEEEISESKP